MAKRGRPRKGSPYKWNRAKVQALEKRLIELQAKIDSGEVATVCPTKKESDEATKAYATKVARGMAKNAAVLRKLKAPTMPISDMVVAASCKQEEAPKDITRQIGQSKELQALLNRFDLMMVADSDEAKALAKAFPLVGRIWDAVREAQEIKVKRQRLMAEMDEIKYGYDTRDMPSINTLTYFLNAPSKQMAEELQAAQNQPPKSLNPQVSMPDIDAVYDILMDADIFAHKPTKLDLLAVIRAEVQKPLRIKKIRLWAYFLDCLFRQNKISGWWQDAFGSAKTFENSKGEPVSAKDLSRELSKAFEDKDKLFKDADVYGFDEATDMITSQRLRYHYYKDIDEALSSL